MIIVASAIILVCIASVSLIFFQSKEPSQKFSFEPVDSIDSTFGYVSKTRTERAIYYFSSNDESYNNALVNKNERVIELAKKHLDLPRQEKEIKIYVNANNEKPLNDGHLNRIVLSKDSEPSIGAIVSNLSDYQLPAWLCIGLELYWQRDEENDSSKILGQSDVLNSFKNIIYNAKPMSLPDYGDAWVIPGYLDENLVRVGHQVALLYVQHLAQKGELKHVVDLFMQEGADIQTVLEQNWSELMETPYLHMDSRYRYFYSYNDVWFEVHTEKLKTKYKQANWEPQQIEEYQNYMELGIRYVEEWLGYGLERPLSIVMHPDPHPSIDYGGRIYRSNDDFEIELFQVYKLPPYKAVHEAVHALTFKKELYSPFYPFTEGIAEYVMYEFEANYKQYVYNKFKQDLESSYQRKNEDLVDMTVIKMYERFTKTPYMPSSEFNLMELLHVNAAMSFVEEGWANRFDSYKFHSKSYGFTEDLDEYNKAGSFVQYLIATYGKDKFLHVYTNVDEIERVYNKSLKDLIDEWKHFLNV
ncbi:hypothetical protein [Paenibacillus tundrae]|uniref:hypothetical protein n=1 Tax=Paenibacillus tundrae TaxID=528187 RepID=UPI0030CD256A